MTIRGAAAIVGVADIKAQRPRGALRTHFGFLADAAAGAIADAGLRKEDIGGLIADGPGGEFPATLSEYLGLRPTFASGITMAGASAPTGVAVAAAAIAAGYADTFLIVYGGVPGFGGGRGSREVEPWSEPFGEGVGANWAYALLAHRHAFEYGTTDEQRAKVAVDQRINAQANPFAFFQGQPLTIQDVLASRVIADPLRLMECVMPCVGGTAVVVTSAERARSLPHRPVYVLGVGQHTTHEAITWSERMTRTPTVVSARRAFQMAGLGPQDMDMVQSSDYYTITTMLDLEDAGFVPKGQSGPWYAENDTTYRGSLPVNTNGGQLSVGQHPGGSLAHFSEAARQLMARAGERQVRDATTCFVNVTGGVMSEALSIVLGTDASA